MVSRNRIIAVARIAMAVVLLSALTSRDAAGQYFGKNKVRYQDFEFEVMSTDHFDIYHYDRERRTVDETARLAERWYARLSKLLDHELSARQPLILYASHPQFRQTTAIPGFISEGTGGVTEGLKNRIVMPLTASLAETSHVLGHELVHAFQFDMSRGRALRLPLWFVEGMAEYLSLGPEHAQTAIWLRDAAIRDDLPDLHELNDPRFFPYRFGHALWAYIGGRWGDGAVRTLFLSAEETGDPLGVLEGLSGMTVDELSMQWHSAVRETYGRLSQSKTPPPGRPLITESMDGGRVNIGPSLSPDGRRIVFLSERDLFSIEMFLADARTGEVIRKLTDLATNPHLDSIQFLQSTGAWDAAGQRFVHSAVTAGRPALVIVDARSGDRLREIELPALGEAINPTWSPNGRYIAFSGLIGGVSDLFIYDLERGSLDRVTNDLFTQIQPSWSPDGRSIALVTDRFSTTLDSLAFGNYRLGLYDVASRSVRPLAGFDDAKNINPRWSPDGRTLYFVSDPSGIPNVFRLTLSTGDLTPVTSVATGVTSITATSPAFDVAARTGEVAYTLFRDGKYGIHVLNAEAARAGEAQLREAAEALPPPDRRPSRIDALLDAPSAGLPRSREFPVSPYDPDLSLEYVGAAATTGFGGSTLGAAVGGGAAFVFTDMLNFHEVTAAVETNGGLKDIGGQLAYINRSSRWNLGGAFQWFPYVTGSFSQSVENVNGEPVIVQRERLFRQTDRRIMGISEYPFNRATRLEFAAGLRSIGFDRELTTSVFSGQTGQLLNEQTIDLDAPGTLNLAQTTGAYVYDTSVFGATSPVLGTRSRLEISPTFGALNFAEVVADARLYRVPARPLTLAGRVLHIGRYGSDGEDNRLSPLFLGYPNLVRGYEVGSFSGAECQADSASDCPAFDRLVGSRIFVANAELRFPLVGLFQREFNYGPVPVEGFLFADTGIAWTSKGAPGFSDLDRRFVSSAGAGIRVNAFGYLVLEFAGVRPFDRPDDGWRFVFNIVPGF